MASITDLENFSITQLERFTITRMEASLNTMIDTATIKDLVRFFFWNDVDYSKYLYSVGNINRDAKNIIATGGEVSLINTEKTFNSIFNDPTELNYSAVLKLGFPAKKSIFVGKGDNINCQTIAKLTIRDKMQDVFERTVGDTNTAVALGGNVLDSNSTLNNWTLGAPDNWNVTNTVAEETTIVRAGSSAKLTKNGGNSSIDQGAIDISGRRETWFAFAFWHRVDATSKQVAYQIYDDEGYYLKSDSTWNNGAATITVDSANGSWTKEVILLKIRATASTLTILIRTGPSGAFNLYIDEVVLIQGNIAVMTWNILTLYGELDDTVTSANTDINYSIWEDWFNDLDIVNIRLKVEGYFTGETILSILRDLADYGGSYIYVDEDGKVRGKKILPEAAVNSYSFTEILEEPETNIAKDDMCNDLRVWYTYDPVAGNWNGGGSVQSTRDTSIAEWGTYAKEVKNTYLWPIASGQADHYRDKYLDLHSNPAKYIIIKVPLIGLKEDLGNNVYLTIPTLEIASAAYRVAGIDNNVMDDATLRLRLKDLSTENLLFIIDTKADWNRGTHTDTEADTNPGYLQTERSKGTFDDQHTDDVEYSQGFPFQQEGATAEITLVTGQTEIKVTSTVKISNSSYSARLQIKLYDVNDNAKDWKDWFESATTYQTKTHTFDLTPWFSVGDVIHVKRFIEGSLFATAYTNKFDVQVEEFKAASSWISATKNWEAGVTYDEVTISVALNGQSGTIYVDVDDNSAFTSADTYNHALEDGENSYDISALASEQYCRVRIEMASDGDDTVQIDWVRVETSA